MSVNDVEIYTHSHAHTYTYVHGQQCGGVTFHQVIGSRGEKL